jgi:hypothetical protein
MDVWLEKLGEAERMRSGFYDFMAKGLMTHEELGAMLRRLEKPAPWLSGSWRCRGEGKNG